MLTHYPRLYEYLRKREKKLWFERIRQLAKIEDLLKQQLLIEFLFYEIWIQDGYSISAIWSAEGIFISTPLKLYLPYFSLTSLNTKTVYEIKTVIVESDESILEKFLYLLMEGDRQKNYLKLTPLQKQLTYNSFLSQKISPKILYETYNFSTIPEISRNLKKLRDKNILQELFYIDFPKLNFTYFVLILKFSSIKDVFMLESPWIYSIQVGAPKKPDYIYQILIPNETRLIVKLISFVESFDKSKVKVLLLNQSHYPEIKLARDLESKKVDFLTQIYQTSLSRSMLIQIPTKRINLDEIDRQILNKALEGAVTQKEFTKGIDSPNSLIKKKLLKFQQLEILVKGVRLDPTKLWESYLLITTCDSELFYRIKGILENFPFYQAIKIHNPGHFTGGLFVFSTGASDLETINYIEILILKETYTFHNLLPNPIIWKIPKERGLSFNIINIPKTKLHIY